MAFRRRRAVVLVAAFRAELVPVIVVADWSAHANAIVRKVVAVAALGLGVVRLVYVVAAAAVGVPSINTPRPGGGAPRVAVGVL